MVGVNFLYENKYPSPVNWHGLQLVHGNIFFYYIYIAKRYRVICEAFVASRPSCLTHLAMGRCIVVLWTGGTRIQSLKISHCCHSILVAEESAYQENVYCVDENHGWLGVFSKWIGGNILKVNLSAEAARNKQRSFQALAAENIVKALK